MKTALTLGFMGSHSIPAAAPSSTTFDMQIQTTTASEVFTIPCQNLGVFNATIDWGDGGATSTITTYNDVDLAHTYATAGTYNISISGTFPNIYFNGVGDCTKVYKVTNLGNVGWSNLHSAFKGCSNLNTFTVGNTDTSGVTQAHNMFQSCTSLTTIDLSGLNLSSVGLMNAMFYGCTGLTSVNFSNSTTASATSMNSLFDGCSGLTTLNVANLNTSSVTNFGNMFNGLISLGSLNVTGFNTSSATTMVTMFQNCAATDIDVSGFNIANVTTSFGNFMNGTGMTTANYDATLIAWDAQVVHSGLTVNFGTSTYTLGGAAATARADLVGTQLWTITDGGGV